MLTRITWKENRVCKVTWLEAFEPLDFLRSIGHFVKGIYRSGQFLFAFSSSYPEGINGGYYSGGLPVQQAHSTTPHDSAPPPPGGHSVVGGGGGGGGGGPNSSAGGAGAGGPTGPTGPTVGSGGAGGPTSAPPTGGLTGIPHSIVSEPDPRPSPPAPSPR